MHFRSSVLALLGACAPIAIALPARVVGEYRANARSERFAVDIKSSPLLARHNKAEAVTVTTTISPAATSASAAANNSTSSVLKVGEEGSEKIRTNGVFASPNGVQGGFVFQKLIMPSNTAGGIEPEYNSSVANTITVVPKLATIAPPAGMVYVDPLSFVISTATPPIEGDTMKVDYIFTQALTLAMDTSKGTIGKLDAATNQFVTEGVGEFEFEADENEWSLTVADMNGEWAVFVPESAVIQEGAGEGEAAEGDDAAAGGEATGEVEDAGSDSDSENEED